MHAVDQITAVCVVHLERAAHAQRRKEGLTGRWVEGRGQALGHRRSGKRAAIERLGARLVLRCGVQGKLRREVLQLQDHCARVYRKVSISLPVPWTALTDRHADTDGTRWHSSPPMG